MKQEYELPYYEPDGDLDSALIFFEVLEIYQDYHVHKDSEKLENAIRNRPEMFQSEIFRNWVADIVTGKYIKKKSGFTQKRTVLRNRLICATVRYYHAMGFPIYYESNRVKKVNACQLAYEKHHVEANSIYEILGNESKNNYGSTVNTGFGPEIQDGTIIWILNGFRPPESVEQIEELEQALKKLSSAEYKRIKQFSQGYVATNCKTPKTQQELEAIEKKLNARPDYQFIKTIQVRNLSI